MSAVRIAAGFLLYFLAVNVGAHDARPVSISITEQRSLQYMVRLQPPDSLGPDQHPVLLLPIDCEQVMGSVYRCAEDLGGRELGLMYPGTNPSLATFFRYETSAGSVTTLLLGPNQRAWQVPAANRGFGEVFLEYLVLGVEHIALGIDHLLFVVCLVILSLQTGEGRQSRVTRLLITITGFTVAHSITLALSVLEIVAVPIALVEALIALSILYLAIEILRPDETLTQRYPVVVASAFGLLHGFGFASVLREIGLPGDQILTGLLAFNVGVEIGQIVFIAIILAMTWLGKKLLSAALMPKIQSATAYGTGTLASFWIFERTFAFWT